jgi:hypothetical protein
MVCVTRDTQGSFWAKLQELFSGPKKIEAVLVGLENSGKSTFCNFLQLVWRVWKQDGGGEQRQRQRQREREKTDSEQSPPYRPTPLPFSEDCSSLEW